MPTVRRPPRSRAWRGTRRALRARRTRTRDKPDRHCGPPRRRRRSYVVRCAAAAIRCVALAGRRAASRTGNAARLRRSKSSVTTLETAPEARCAAASTAVFPASSAATSSVGRPAPRTRNAQPAAAVAATASSPRPQARCEGACRPSRCGEPERPLPKTAAHLSGRFDAPSGRGNVHSNRSSSKVGPTAS